jgi:hypothetical protein
VLEPVDVHLERKLGSLVAGRPPGLELAEVIDARHALETGLLVQQGVDVADREPEFVV